MMLSPQRRKKNQPQKKLLPNLVFEKFVNLMPSALLHVPNTEFLDAWHSDERFQRITTMLEMEAKIKLQIAQIKKDIEGLLKETESLLWNTKERESLLSDIKEKEFVLKCKEYLLTVDFSYCYECNCKIEIASCNPKTNTKRFVSYYDEKAYCFEWQQFYCQQCAKL